MSTELRLRRMRMEDAEADPRLALNSTHPRFSYATMMWTAIGTSAVGTGLSLYGANKQSKAQAGADNANRAAITEQDLNSWKAYLMQRGLNPQGVTQFGQVPTNAAPQNARLPLWANLSFTKPGAPAGTSMVRRRTTARM